MPDQADETPVGSAPPPPEGPNVTDGFRSIMERKGLKLTALAAESGIPYRSLQNYFSRKTEMPVSVYLKLCGVLGVDNGYLARERFELDFDALKQALTLALGSLLPRPDFTPDGAMILIENGEQPRSQADIARHAGALAMFVRSHYDILRERAVGEALRDEEW